MKKTFLQVTGSAAILLLITNLVSSCSTPGQLTANATAEDITRAVDSSNWVFTATIVRPQQGKTRNISGTYTAVYNNNKLMVYLPYYGVAYGGADVMSGRGPMDFSAIEFKFDKQQIKPGEWKLIFEPIDYREVQRMTFILYNNGNASLDVIMTNRSAVSYDGTIQPPVK